LATYIDALVEMKKSFGKELNIGNTFAARAAITGKLVLSDYAKRH
jgi:hypothetical protein